MELFYVMGILGKNTVLPKPVYLWRRSLMILLSSEASEGSTSNHDGVSADLGKLPDVSRSCLHRLQSKSVVSYASAQKLKKKKERNAF